MNTKRLAISLLSTLVFGIQIAFAGGIPENVTGLDAIAVDSNSIGLTWDSAKDADGNLVDHYRIYYGTFSVFEAGEGDYDDQVDTPNNTPSFVLSDLEPGTDYYFSATAVSSDELESEEYSFEASATTMGGEEDEGEEADTTSPTVISVMAPDKLHVQVVFSEAVQLPVAVPEASFSIVEQINPANTLTVISATIDPSDESGATVLLESSEQTQNVNYIVTAGVTIRDLADNPIVSGSTDSGLFLGSSVEFVEEEEEEEAMEEEEEEAMEEEPVMEAAGAEDCEEDFGCFLAHMTNCSAAKVMASADKGKYEYMIELTGSEGADCKVKYAADKHPSIIYAGAEMECSVAKGTYTAEKYGEAFDLEKCSGSLTNDFEAPEFADTTPPEDITNLLLSFREQAEKFVVIMNWTASINTAKDLVDQMMYMSMDRGVTYDKGKALGAITVKTEIANLTAGKEYTFKVTTKDAAGNESTGVVKSIRLPSTGVGVGLALLGSAIVAGRVFRRKENE